MLSATQAQQEVNAAMRLKNNSRRMPQVPDIIKKMAAENTVHVFNVGPWDVWVPMGSLGEFFIPKRGSDTPGSTKDYGAMRPLPGIMVEPYIVDESNFGHFQDEGRRIANEIIGVGPMRDPSQSLLHLGVFVAEGKKPTDAELKAANAKLRAHCEQLIVEAREAYKAGPQAVKETIRKVHYDAAAELGRTDEEAWIQHTTVETKVICEMCGTKVTSSAALCPVCLQGGIKSVINEEKFKKFKSRLAE